MGRRIGNNIFIAHDKRNEQMEFLLDNMQAPDFRFDTVVEDTQLDTAAITYRLMNHQGFGRGDHTSTPSWGSVAHFMNSIQSYFPKAMQVKYRLWLRNSFIDNGIETIADDTKELLNEMVDWLITMKEKIEDHLTKHYYKFGKGNHLEILKRRFKLDWSERTESSVDANVKEDTTINIHFEDA